MWEKDPVLSTEYFYYMQATNLLLQQALLPRSIVGPGDPTLPILGYALRMMYVCDPAV